MTAARTATGLSEAVPRVPLRRFDVAVYGGSPASIAAAIAAARRGVRVALVTPSGTLGGDLTLGLLTQWDLQNAPDGSDIQSGLFHEFHDALPNGFDPDDAAAYFRRRIEAADTITWFASAKLRRVLAARAKHGRRISFVRFTSRGTNVAVAAACFIDASDNADFAAAAGAAYDVGRQDQGRDLAMQPATLIFTLSGVNWKRVNPQGDDQAAGYADLLSAYKPLSRRAIVPDANFQLNADGTVMVNAIDIFGVDGRKRSSVREAVRIARAESIHLVPFLREHIPGFEHARIARFAQRLYVRETRHVRALTWISADYIWNETRPYDTVALAAYPMDVHPVHQGEAGGDGWAEEPRLYGIPLRALVTYGFTNLAVAGPSMSATHTAAGSVRVTPTAIAEGEAAGEACAQGVQRGYSLRHIALSKSLISELRERLQLTSMVGSR